MPLTLSRLAIGFVCLLAVTSLVAQDKSVKPGVNDSFRDPDVKQFEGRFEVESREVYALRKEIVAACQIKPGQTLADVGAGTGLFTRMFSGSVGQEGRVLAVDISQAFLDHIQKTTREAGQQNVETLLCTDDSTKLPPNMIDVAFICDTYHHFEFPLKTMTSLFQAMEPGGRVILIDFKRIEGESSDWTLNHVRAGQEVFEAEVLSTGFRKAREEKELLTENYFVVFEKPTDADTHAHTGTGRGMGMGRGRGAGRGRGPDPGMRKDQDVFHDLLDHHAEIRRSVEKLDNGVVTLTESDRPEVASKIQEHVASMHQRVVEGRGLGFWDPLYVAIFDQHAQIEMSVENTDKGVRVKETSKDPAVVTLIQAHAEVVSGFVAHGFEEAEKSHPVPPAKPTPAAKSLLPLVFPIITTHGGVVVRPTAADQPRTGAKVVFDVTVDSKPTEVNKGLDRAARLLNLYGASGLQAKDVSITVVLHGEATKSTLNDAGYKTRFETEQNPNLPLIRVLQKAGVEVLVCGQALNYKNFADEEVAPEIQVAAAAMTVVVNRQMDGYAYVPLH